ncbi:hypothetical protein ACJJTC_005990 [Scirpophaga incertulas]
MATVNDQKKNRKIARMQFTIDAKKLEETIAEEKPGPKLQSIFDTFKTIADKLFSVDATLKSTVVSSALPEEEMLLLLDIEETTDHEICFNTLKAQWPVQEDRRVQDITLDDKDKFQYLLRATEPGTPARELSFPPSGENYRP